LKRVRHDKHGIFLHGFWGSGSKIRKENFLASPVLAGLFYCPKEQSAIQLIVLFTALYYNKITTE